MHKRKLKRQLGLVQVVMLGTAGAMGAELFVLTGHAASISGPALVLALVVGGLLSYSIAINYSELASTFPETGGAMTYVREAWGRNLLSFLVGSMDCLSSTFYSALSAVGFAYSLQIFFPFLPIVPAAIAVILVFIILNLLGVGNIGKVQVLLGGILMLVFLVYIVLGFAMPGGFQWETYLWQGDFFIHQDAWSNFASLLSTIALAYVAYIGFEVIADDAEEIKNPDRNIPLSILLSLTLLIVLYPLIILVTLGTIPWSELAGSEVALTDAVSRFIPGWGKVMLGIAGIIATVTTLNSAMLSATREAFTLSRDGMWPRFLAHLSYRQTPYAAILVIGGVIIAVAAVGLVDFLSYISSSGYLFVLFWSNLALIRLRQRYPDLRRPFKVPFFPLTAYLAMASCLLIIAFTAPRALGFGVALLTVLSSAYYLGPVVRRIYEMRIKSIEKSKDRILVPVANPQTGGQLIYLAAILAQASEETNLCVFNAKVTPKESPEVSPLDSGSRPSLPQSSLPDHILREAQKRNVPLYTKVRQGPSIAQSILNEIETSQNVRLALVGWPGPLSPHAVVENPVKTLLEKAETNVAVLLSRNLGPIRNILVPIGGGPHSRLALRIAFEIADQENACVTALHLLSAQTETEEITDETIFINELIIGELGFIPPRIATRITQAESLIQGILDETKRQSYELVIMGASDEYSSGTRLFGSVDDWIIEHVENSSVLLVRRYEPVVIRWLRRQIEVMEEGSVVETANGL
ncbi:MAG TPA: amino acid permease [Anaerolineales bacterium]|nr:amino acid permease [Anaerolineales bacterium]